MRIDPLGKYRRRDYALLTPGQRCLYVETKNGKQLFSGKRDVSNALAKLSDFTCYVGGGLQQLKHTTGATEWLLKTWRGRDVSMLHVPTGTTVNSLQQSLSGADDPFLALSTCMDWLEGYGIAPGAISSMAWKLLRAAQARPVSLGFDPEIADRAFFGGRQEIWQPDTYKNFRSVDIKAAYPTAMAARPIALSLRSVHIDTELDPTVAGLAEADVIVPRSLTYAPLPYRVARHAIQFPTDDFSGVWTWAELAAAKSLGCDVTVTKCWAPRTEYDLFSTWWEIAQTGRSLPHGGDLIAKTIANATWGQFSMRGDERGQVHWTDDKGKEPFEVELPARRIPHVYGLHIAAEITARVRTQLLLEGLYGTNAWIIHVDTDGMIIHGDAPAPGNAGEAFGQWRDKDTMNQVEIRAPQFYRYTKPDDPNRWHYVASGRTPDQAVATFARHPDTITSISFLSRGDVCIPTTSSRDTKARAALLDQLDHMAAV